MMIIDYDYDYDRGFNEYNDKYELGFNKPDYRSGKLSSLSSISSGVMVMLVVAFLSISMITMILSSSVVGAVVTDDQVVGSVGDGSGSHQESYQEISDLLDNYYSSFLNMDLDAYLATQDLSMLSDEELAQKKENIRNMWAGLEPSYYHLSNLDISLDRDEGAGVATYDLEAGVKDPRSGEKFDYEMSMSAILSLTSDGWKVLMVVPTSQLDEIVVLNEKKEKVSTLGEALLNDDKEKGDNGEEGDKGDEDREENGGESSNGELRGDVGSVSDEKVPVCVFDDDKLFDLLDLNIKDYVSSTVYDLLVGDFVAALLISKSSDDGSPSVEEVLIKVDNGLLRIIDHDGVVVDKGSPKDRWSSIFEGTIDDAIESLSSKNGASDQKRSSAFLIKYFVITDPCTLSAISDGTIGFDKAFDEGLISVKGNSFGSKIKAGLGKLFLSVKGWFKSSPDTDYLLLKAEDFTIDKGGKYTFIGPTSRGPGELYLGTGGSVASITFENSLDNGGSSSGTIVNLYVRVSDDGKHKDGSRDTLFLFNNDENGSLTYHHKSKNTVTKSSAWSWEYVGAVELTPGNNRLEIIKPEQTSAAFIMDELVLTKEKVAPEDIDEMIDS